MRYPGALTLEEKVDSLLQSDPLLSIRFFDAHCRRSCLEPEKALMLAVLEDAVTCIQKGKRWFRETVDWILTEDDDGLFSFDSTCEALGFNAPCLRLGLSDMVARQSASSRKTNSRGSQEPTKKRDRARIVRATA